jgi:Putative restriction endonuclease
MYRRAHELGSQESGWRKPSAQWVATAERLAALADRLPALLNGEDHPGDIPERLVLAQMCYNKKLHVAAARFWAEALKEDPKLGDGRQAWHRYNAARSAALASPERARTNHRPTNRPGPSSVSRLATGSSSNWPPGPRSSNPPHLRQGSWRRRPCGTGNKTRICPPYATSKSWPNSLNPSRRNGKPSGWTSKPCWPRPSREALLYSVCSTGTGSDRVRNRAMNLAEGCQMSTVSPTRASVDDLLAVEGKAELIGGRIVKLMGTGFRPNRVAGRCFRLLDDWAEQTGRGVALTDNVIFAVPELPSGRESFSPDASYYVGPLPENDMKPVPGPPTLAVEVRSESDSGPAAERAMAEMRADYFAAGTLASGTSIRSPSSSTSTALSYRTSRQRTVGVRPRRRSRPFPIDVRWFPASFQRPESGTIGRASPTLRKCQNPGVSLDLPSRRDYTSIIIIRCASYPEWLRDGPYDATATGSPQWRTLVLTPALSPLFWGHGTDKMV